MKENLKFMPLHHVNELKIKSAREELCWVLMRSLQQKVHPGESYGTKCKRTELKFGYEIAKNLFCEFFMPMKECISTVRDKQILHRKPAITGMFFVRDSLTNIRTLASKRLGFELMFLKGRKYLEPVIISDDEMNSFIAAVSSNAEVRFFSPDDKTLNQTVGKRVRITQNGTTIDGYVVSIRGSKRRWLRICIKDCLAAHIEINLDKLKSGGQIVEMLN